MELNDSSVMSNRSAVRIDALTGLREEAEFVGEGDERLFALRYTPPGALTAGVVVCEPLLAQFIAHYRTGTVLARLLARHGLAVQRFHYRGTGNSDGSVDSLDLDSMTEDAIAAAERLKEATGVERVAYLGIKIGGYPAAAASQDGGELILDSPPLTGRIYIRNAFRSHAVVMMQSGVPTASTAELQQALQETDDVNLLGCRLSKHLHDSLESRTLTDQLGDTPRRTLLIASERAGELKPEAKELQALLEERGFDVSITVRAKEDPLWYVEHSAPEDRPETHQVANAIAGWMNLESNREAERSSTHA